MSAPEAAAAIARGVQRAAKSNNIEIETHELPLSDGGADFLEVIATASVGMPRAVKQRLCRVCSATGQELDSPFAVGFSQTSSLNDVGCAAALITPFIAAGVAWHQMGGFVWALGVFVLAAIASFLLLLALSAAGNKLAAHRAKEFLEGHVKPDLAFIQLSSAAGLAQIPKDQRDPTRTSTYGVGQLILAALDQGVRDITIGVGNSATVDAGAGALAALGVKFFDQRDQPIERPTGGDLSRIARIDASSLDPRLKRTKITVACDVDNPLLGHDGAAPTFAPQKGASLVQVDELERGLANFVNVLRSAGFDPKPDATHTGAAGGFGFGLATVLGARLIPTIWLFTGYGWDEEFYPGPSLVLTGEGRIDAQTVRGKLPIAVAKEARAAGVPTIALVGSVGEGAEKTLDPAHASRPGGETDGGLLDYLVITPYGMPLDEALRRAPELLEAAAERAVRDWLARSQ
jgi:glycerate kinase